MLSVILITKNVGNIVERTLLSVKDLADEIVVIDNFSTDNTLEIVRRYTNKVFLDNNRDLGALKRHALSRSTQEWVLSLDADEVLSKKLKQEIQRTLSDGKNQYNAFYIKYRNHFLGRKLRHGGEDYKMIRLFQRNAVSISKKLVHEGFQPRKGIKIGELDGYINHYSYRSIFQTFKKFTDYGWRDASERFQKGENLSIKKLFLYPPHMIYARFIKSGGYKDGLWRLPLDIGFGYMEFLAYWGVLIKRIFKKINLRDTLCQLVLPI